MLLHLRLIPIPGRILLFQLFTTFLYYLGFFQSPAAPAVTVHQGLPANNDGYQKFLYSNGTYATYAALTIYPYQFYLNRRRRLDPDRRQLQSTLWNGTEVTLSLIGLPAGTYHVAIPTSDGTVYEREVFDMN